MDPATRELLVHIVVFGGFIGASVVSWWLNEKRKEKNHKQMLERWDAEEKTAKARGDTPPVAPVAGGLPPLPVMQAIPPTHKSTRKHRVPDDAALAEYMRNLPQFVPSVAHAKNLARKLEHEPKIGLWQTSLNRTIEKIAPTEMIYAMTWNAHCVATQTHGESENRFEAHGVVFFSDSRFLFYKDPANIVDIPLENIYAVDAHKGHFFDGVSFRTQSEQVQLTFAGTIDRKLFRDMVIHIASDASSPIIEGAAPVVAPQVCECPTCGASVIIHPGVINKCEYCDRFVEKQQAPPPAAPAPLSVADEIKKHKVLLDKGIITEAEFEDIKNRLLSRL